MAEELVETTAATEHDAEQADSAPEEKGLAQQDDEKSTEDVQDGPEDEGEITEEEFEELRANEVAFSWQASEFVHHSKGPGWYWALVGLLIVLTGAAALLHYWLEIVAFVAMGGAIFVYARKPPKTLLYELTPQGIKAEGRDFPFTGFRSFGVLSDIEWHTIDLEPTKRFSPRLAIIFDDDDFDTIVGHLELHLPRVDREPDVVERLTRILRF